MAELIRKIRDLCARGVTHFVVTDELYREMQRIWRENDQRLGGDAVIASDVLKFRGNRILRQEDLKHLPFDAGSNSITNTQKVFS